MVSDLCIGIVCAEIVLAGTDLGGAGAGSPHCSPPFRPRSAAGSPVHWASREPILKKTKRSGASWSAASSRSTRSWTRHSGKSSQLRYHSPVLQQALDGLVVALASWRTAAVLLARLPVERARQEAAAVLAQLPEELRLGPEHDEPARWIAGPAHLLQACDAAVRRLAALPAATPSLRLLADRAAEALAGLSHALNGLALLIAVPARPGPHRRGVRRLRVPDWLPPLVNAGRAFVVIGAAALFWIVTAWPNGAGAITFAAIGVILFAPRADQAYATAMGFMIGPVSQQLSPRSSHSRCCRTPRPLPPSVSRSALSLCRPVPGWRNRGRPLCLPQWRKTSCRFSVPQTQ